MTEDFIFIGEDFGMGANKLWSEKGGLETVSQIANNGTAKLDGMLGLKSRKRPMHIASEFGSFYVGTGAHEHGRPVESVDFARLTGAPEMRALLYSSITKYQIETGWFDRPLHMMVGLPLQMMMGADAKQYQTSVKSWLKGKHEFEADGALMSFEIAKVSITSQPVGALYDYVLDLEGNIQPGRHETMLDDAEVGIVSVGFNTVELLVVKDGAAVERFTAGNTVGVRRLLELCNRDGLYSLGELDERLRSGSLKTELKTAVPIWAREVNGEIESRWSKNHKRFTKILVVGGGALILKDALTAQFGPKAWISDAPVLSIARGLYKLSVMKR